MIAVVDIAQPVALVDGVDHVALGLEPAEGIRKQREHVDLHQLSPRKLRSMSISPRATWTVRTASLTSGRADPRRPPAAALPAPHRRAVPADVSPGPQFADRLVPHNPPAPRSTIRRAPEKAQRSSAQAAPRRGVPRPRLGPSNHPGAGSPWHHVQPGARSCAHARPPERRFRPRAAEGWAPRRESCHPVHADGRSGPRATTPVKLRCPGRRRIPRCRRCRRTCAADAVRPPP